MLGNADFAKMVGGGDSGGDKVRFDLKTISKWDKQLNAKQQKKQPFSKGGKKGSVANSIFNAAVEEDAENDGGGRKGAGYRDRASERRKAEIQQSREEQQQLQQSTSTVNGNDVIKSGIGIEQNIEVIAGKLDAEQTKLLGGDVEHTHLVKGLDYALLEKTRRNAVVAGATTTPAVDDEDTVRDGIDVMVNTILGKKLQSIIFSKSSSDQMKTSLSNNSQNQQQITQRGLHRSIAQNLARTAFEYQLDPASERDIPLILSKSRREANRTDECINYVFDAKLMFGLKEIIQQGGGKLLTAKQKKKREEKEKQRKAIAAASEALQAAEAAAATLKEPSQASNDNIFDSIYGDDIPTGKYIPSDGADDATDHVSSHSESKGNTLVKDIFSDLFDKPSAKNTVTLQSKDIDKSSSGEKHASDLLKPVRDLLSAQTARQRAVESKTVPKGTEPMQMVIEKNSKGKEVVHRDVFATTKGKVVKATREAGTKRGSYFGIEGTYDELFPETTQYDEVYDSDDGPGPAKKAKSASNVYDDD